MKTYSANIDVAALAYEKFGVTLKENKKEWHLPCPDCGGVDRFVIFQSGYFFCRQGSHPNSRGWLRDWRGLSTEAREAAKQRQAEIRAADLKRLAEAEEKFRGGGAEKRVQAWHRALLPDHIGALHRRGIHDSQIEDYVLGYCRQYPIKDSNGTLRHWPAHIVPIYSPFHNGDLVNVQGRLDGDLPKEIQRYRQRKGLRPRVFYAADAVQGPAVIVEGAYKSMVMFDFLEQEYQIAGLPGKYVDELGVIELSHFDPLWIAADPDATRENIVAIVEQFPRHDVRVMELPMKPDDAVLAGLDRATWNAMMRQAWKGVDF